MLERCNNGLSGVRRPRNALKRRTLRSELNPAARLCVATALAVITARALRRYNAVNNAGAGAVGIAVRLGHSEAARTYQFLRVHARRRAPALIALPRPRPVRALCFLPSPRSGARSLHCARRFQPPDMASPRHGCRHVTRWRRPPSWTVLGVSAVFLHLTPSCCSDTQSG